MLEAPEPAFKEAASLLTHAARPIMLAGYGVVQSDSATKHLSMLAELLGAPIVTTLKASGLFYGDPSHLGSVGEIGSTLANEAVQDADCVLAVGASLNAWTTNGGRLFRGSSLVNINLDSAKQMEFDVDVWIQADCAESLQWISTEVIRCIEPNGRTPWMDNTQATAGNYYSSNVHGVVDPRAALACLDMVLPKDRALVLDGGHFVTFAAQMLTATNPRKYIYVWDSGAIGQGIGTSIGASVALANERVTLVVGDGGYSMGIADLETAVRYNLPLTVIVMNDAGFGQERMNLAARGYSAEIAGYPAGAPNVLAEALGARGYRIASESEMESTLRDALSGDGTVVVDIRVDPSVINPTAEKVAARFRADN